MKIFNSSQSCPFTIGFYKDYITLTLINCSNPRSYINLVKKSWKVKSELSEEVYFQCLFFLIFTLRLSFLYFLDKVI